MRDFRLQADDAKMTVYCTVYIVTCTWEMLTMLTAMPMPFATLSLPMYWNRTFHSIFIRNDRKMIYVYCCECVLCCCCRCVSQCQIDCQNEYKKYSLYFVGLWLQLINADKTNAFSFFLFVLVFTSHPSIYDKWNININVQLLALLESGGWWWLVAA